MKVRTDLQGLRALAVTLVVITHAAPHWVPGGYVGVDIFFVLSGFLITGMLVNEKQTSGDIAFFRFYCRRFKRLFPAMVTMIMITCVTAVVLLSAYEFEQLTSSTPFALSWLSNIHFAYSHVGYFDDISSSDLFLHTWSLGVEEQFYLAWPLLVFYTLFSPTSPNDGGKQSTILIWLLIGLTSFALYLLWIRTNADFGFYLTPARVWQFALGGFIFMLTERESTSALRQNSQFFTPPAKHLWWFGLALILVTSGITPIEIPNIHVGTILASLGAAIIIACGSRNDHTYTKLLDNRYMIWLGDRAYSLYLWHWPIIVIGSILLIDKGIEVTLALILCSIFAATLSFQFVEYPFWKGKLSKIGIKSGLIATTVLVVVVAGGWIATSAHNQSRKVLDQAQLNWRSDVPELYSRNCDSWYFDAKVQPCLFGNETAPKTAVIIGDSIGLQWFSIFSGIYKSPEWRIIAVTKSACAMVDQKYYYERIGSEYTICEEWRNQLIADLEIVSPNVIFFGSDSYYPFTEEEWIEGSIRILEKLHRVTEQLTIIAGTPVPGFDGPGCVARNINDQGKINVELCLSIQSPKAEEVSKYLASAASSFENVRVLDLNNLVCPNGKCIAVDPYGTIVFRDGKHLTDSFVISQLPAIKSRLEILWQR